MKSILEVIQPIKLLSGSHADTAQTGQGCAMNVIAYLNGENQITDNSPCVCVTIRKPLIWLNDYLRDEERQELVPYLLRAMGSATDDKIEINRRLALLVVFANDMAGVAQRAAHAAHHAATAAAHAVTAHAAAHAAHHAATTATAAHTATAHAAAHATAHTADAAAHTADAADAADAAHAVTAHTADAADAADAAAYVDAAYVDAAYRAEIKKIGFAYLDAALPKAPQAVAVEVFARAKSLAELAAI